MSTNIDLDTYEPVAKIVVIGVGGGGNNAVNRMIDESIANVDFYVMNTDKQALSTSKAPNRIVLGENVTRGLGAGGDPAIGREAALQSTETIREVVKGADMVFIAAGMGGGTGTGASPVIAQIAKEEGALVVAIVTRPFSFEGKKRLAHSVEGLNELKDAVDSIITVSNDKLLVSSGTQDISNAFCDSDRVLAQTVRTVTDIILVPALINLDFADVRSTLKGCGMTLIGFGQGSGEGRVRDAAEMALNSPLLETSMSGATRGIIQVTAGKKVSLFECEECTRRIVEQSGNDLDLKLGVSINDQLDDMILISVIATGFNTDSNFLVSPSAEAKPWQPEPLQIKDDASSENEEGLSEDSDKDILPNLLDL